MMHSPAWRGLWRVGVAVAALVCPAPPVFAQPTSKVILAAAQIKELPATSKLVGTVRANRISVVGAEVAGLVAELAVREGDYLKKGDVICRLNADILQLELRAAREKLQSLLAAVEVSKANLERWTLEKERITRLSEQDRANAKELYDTVAEHLIAKNRLREAQQDVAEQKALVDLKNTELLKTTIRAPFDGYVTELHTEVGQWIERGGPVVELIDVESVMVRVDAPESAISSIRVGDEARVTFDALPGSFSGRIKHVIPKAHEQARTFPVDIEVANPQHALRSGLFARAVVRTGPPAEAVAVPKDAVVHKQGLDRVWMVQQGGPEGAVAIPVSVTLGSEVGQWVAITSGNVFPGMNVVIRGNEQLMPFPSAVEIVDEDALITGVPSAPSPDQGTDAVQPPTAGWKHAPGTG